MNEEKVMQDGFLKRDVGIQENSFIPTLISRVEKKVTKNHLVEYFIIPVGVLMIIFAGGYKFQKILQEKQQTKSSLTDFVIR